MKSQQDDLYFNPFTIGFQTVESKTTGLEAIRLTDEPYKDIIFQYGKVSFDADEENDVLHLRFEYEILDKANKKFKPEPFQKYIGKLLEELIIQGTVENSITYTGGTDEN